MTKRQRVVDRVKYIKRNHVLGAGRTAALDALRQVYEINAATMRKWCLGVAGADYWN